MFKKGDYFESLKDVKSGRGYNRREGEVKRIISVVGGLIYYEGCGGENCVVGDRASIRPAVLSNPLNKKLYPNRIEKDGYLIRRDS